LATDGRLFPDDGRDIPDGTPGRDHRNGNRTLGRPGNTTDCPGGRGCCSFDPANRKAIASFWTQTRLHHVWGYRDSRGFAGHAKPGVRYVYRVPPEIAPKATSFLLLGGILAAFIGPELAVRGRGLLDTEYAGSFLLLSLSYFTGLIIVSFNQDIAIEQAEHHSSGRPLSEILRSPVIILAVSAAALGYGIMSFIMTATPISMHNHSGHSLEATKFVIQSHIVAMYLPALVLLGAGWNFLFLSGTNLLPRGYRRLFSPGPWILDLPVVQ